jgi:hypothetical protein
VQLSQTQRTFFGAVAVLEKGDLDLQAHVALNMSEEDFGAAGRRLGGAFAVAREAAVLEDEFNDLKFNSESLLRGGGRELLAPLIARSYENFQRSLSRLHHDHRYLLAGVERLGLDEENLLSELARISLDAALSESLWRVLSSRTDGALEELKKSAELARSCGMDIDWSASRSKVEAVIVELLDRVELERIESILGWVDELGIPLQLYRAQERFFELGSALASHKSARVVGRQLGISEDLVQSILEGVR